MWLVHQSVCRKTLGRGQKCDRAKVCGGDGGNDSVFYFSSGNHDDLEVAKLCAMFESQAVAHWKIEGLYQLMFVA